MRSRASQSPDSQTGPTTSYRSADVPVARRDRHARPSRPGTGPDASSRSWPRRRCRSSSLRPASGTRPWSAARRYCRRCERPGSKITLMGLPSWLLARQLVDAAEQAAQVVGHRHRRGFARFAIIDAQAAADVEVVQMDAFRRAARRSGRSACRALPAGARRPAAASRCGNRCRRLPGGAGRPRCGRYRAHRRRPRRTCWLSGRWRCRGGSWRRRWD